MFDDGVGMEIWGGYNPYGGCEGAVQSVRF